MLHLVGDTLRRSDQLVGAARTGKPLVELAHGGIFADDDVPEILHCRSRALIDHRNAVERQRLVAVQSSGMWITRTPLARSLRTSSTIGSSNAGTYRSFASGFETSRAHSMKSCATGLTVRSFNRMMATGAGLRGSTTGKILVARREPANRIIDRGYIAR
jgi:hypothetical protein